MKSGLDRYNLKKLLGLILAAMFCLTIFTWNISNIPNQSGSYTYLVKLRYQISVLDHDGDFREMMSAHGAKYDFLYPENLSDDVLSRWLIVRDSHNISSLFKKNPKIFEVVENDSQLFFEDPDEFQKQQTNNVSDDKTWGLRVPLVEEALKIIRPTRTVIVAVVDTGCDLNHPALKDSLVAGHNFAGGDVNDPSNRDPREMHATHVTGTIVAKPDSYGFHGISYGIAKVMPVRVLDESGRGTTANVARGVVYAVDHGAQVINMSLGSTTYTKLLHDAVIYAKKNNVKMLAAKGNSKTDKSHYPADYPEVMSVTATALNKDGTEERAFFSNYGNSSACAAPGHFIYSSIPGGRYMFASGTSMACPHAAACVADLLSVTDLSNDEVRKILATAGDKLKTDKPIGKRINLLKFVQKAKHLVMYLDEKIRHGYNRCCAEAGIPAWEYNYNDSRSSTRIYQDQSGYYSFSRSYYDSKECGPIRSRRDTWDGLYHTTFRCKDGIRSPFYEKEMISAFPPGTK